MQSGSDPKNCPTIGRFEIVRSLGKGAQAKVKLAIDSSTGRKVALKVFTNMTESLLVDFKKELTALKNLSHPNVIELIDYGKEFYRKPNGSK